MEDPEEEVVDITPAASTMSANRMENVMSLISSIQGNHSQTAQSSLSALLSGGRQATTVAVVHPLSQDLATWARRHGSVKPESYKAACEIGGISYNTYLYLDEENELVRTGVVFIYNKDAFIYNNNSLFFRFRVQVLVFFLYFRYRVQVSVYLLFFKFRV
jgi:hypothetical protein